MTTQWYSDKAEITARANQRLAEAQERQRRREEARQKVLGDMRITYDDLLELGACGGQLTKFRRLFGTDAMVHITYQNLVLAVVSDLNITWLIYKLKPEIYQDFHQHLMIHYRVFDRKTDAVLARYKTGRLHDNKKAIVDPDWQAAEDEYDAAMIWCVAHYLGVEIPEGVQSYA